MRRKPGCKNRNTELIGVGPCQPKPDSGAVENRAASARRRDWRAFSGVLIVYFRYRIIAKITSTVIVVDANRVEKRNPICGHSW
jgi:hypothetical protein